MIYRTGFVLLVALAAMPAVHSQEVSDPMPAIAGDERQSQGSAIYSPFSSDVRPSRNGMAAAAKSLPAAEAHPGLEMTLVAGVACGAALVWLLRL